MKIRLIILELLSVGIYSVCVSVSADPVYVVQEGDTLWSIARAHGLDYGQLCKSNGKQQGWSSIRPGQKIIVGELLDESGDIALFAGRTESDIAFNKANDWRFRNSLFMRRRTVAGTNEWQLIMTANDKNIDFEVMKARLSKDGRFVWMVCNPHTSTYYNVCSLELATKKFKELIDGDSVTEQAEVHFLSKGRRPISLTKTVSRSARLGTICG